MNQVLQYTSILTNSWNKLFTCLDFKKVSPFFPQSQKLEMVKILFPEVPDKVFTSQGTRREMQTSPRRIKSNFPPNQPIQIFPVSFNQTPRPPKSSNSGEVGERGAAINYILPNKTQDHQSVSRRRENQERSTQIHLDSSRMKTDTRDPAGLGSTKGS